MSEQITKASAQQQQQENKQNTQDQPATNPIRRIRVETIAKHITSEWSQNKHNHNRNKSNPLEGASWLSNTIHHAMVQCAVQGFEIVFEFEGKLFKIDRSAIYDARPKKSLVASHSYNVFTSRALFPAASSLFATLDYMIKEFSNKDRSDNKEHNIVVPGTSRLSTELFEVSKSDAVQNVDLNGKKSDLETQLQHYYKFYCQTIAKYTINSKIQLPRVMEDLKKEKCPEGLAKETVDSIEFCRNNAGSNKMIQGLYEARFKFQEEMVKSFSDEKKLLTMMVKE